MQATIPIPKEDTFKLLPKIGGKYNHYKGGQYEALFMARHSELDFFKEVLADLEKIKLPAETKIKVQKLKKILLDDLVVYRSLHYGSHAARPLHMWHERVAGCAGYTVGRFELINNG